MQGRPIDPPGIAELSAAPYATLAALRATAPVAWIPELDAWLVTRRDLALAVQKDAETFTVDDPRFTTAAVLGASMLSVDGPDHQLHRAPFAPAFRAAAVRDTVGSLVRADADALVARTRQTGDGELRTALAGPLAVTTISRFLGLDDIHNSDVLEWYVRISRAITELTVSGSVSTDDQDAVDRLRTVLLRSFDAAGTGALAAVAATGALTAEQASANAAVIMFGAIETAEGMTANALRHLFGDPASLAAVRADRTLVPGVVEESLRLEPAAAIIDRYATRTVDIGGARIGAGDRVSVSLLAANRDPAEFADPDRFDIRRRNARHHLSFVQGPHACIGVHLARLETIAAIEAVLDAGPTILLDHERTDDPRGLIFRKPERVTVRWSAPNGS